MAKQRRVAVMIDLAWSYKYHVEVYAGCHQYAAEARWDCTNSQFADQAIKPGPGESPYDGILGRIEGKAANKAKIAGVPVVNVWMNSPARVALPNVFVDFEAVGAMAARHASACENHARRPDVEAPGFSCGWREGLLTLAIRTLQ